MKEKTSKWIKKKVKYQLPQEVYNRLQELYIPEIERVEQLTDLDLSSWKEPKKVKASQPE